ncbi:GNAT family N-acetyltransferase [Amycolatopsis sp. 195334CR]|uniref:GNAT family N-acetyltransferase n=1 Tax=Amycolatopsis sp. 195334CR TaxID=2814588 RepID=UPI001A8F1F0A|nr:GNAT family N-acetyltransferase [Amycolatopsis sp. 195334CR]MBN6038116.1 GNAT family N-acetyltransferase [Amycolatopsis sp. 195334CR]
MTSELSRAERALHHRAGLACAAAREAGVPGRFRVWAEAGLLAVLATDPELSFLSTVSGISRENTAAAVELAQAEGLTAVASADLALPGMTRAGDRLLAVRPLEGEQSEASVVEAGDEFLDVLLAGYQVSGVVGAYIAAEHSIPALRRFLVVEDGEPIAAAGMTVHDDVAVLGGASTLPAHRGRGAQPCLLRHRLAVAAEAGCTLAVATARPGSVSAANLAAAGFTLHRRSAWRTEART